MAEGKATTVVLRVDNYTAELKVGYYTIKSRGITIGHLDLEDGMWVARGQVIHFAAPTAPASHVDPLDALRAFLRREAYLTQKEL